jgi:hypothetical protein
LKEQLQQLGITPSDSAGDSTFHRRVFLDVLGRLPTPDETRAYLSDADLKKREKLIDRLLAGAGRKGVPAEKEGKDKLVLKVYPVGDLVPIDEADELVHVITKSIGPKNSTPSGAVIHYFSSTQSLVISQSAENHERVQALLDALRKARTELKQKPQ